MRRSKESGTQLVEFAIILPLLIFIALAAAEGSNLFRVYEVVTNAAREGTRLASLSQYSSGVQNVKAQRSCKFTNKSLSISDPVCQGVANYAQNNGLIGSGFQHCGTLTVNVNQAYTAAGGSNNYSQVNVVCTYQLQWLPKLPFYNVANSINVSQTAVFENLY